MKPSLDTFVLVLLVALVILSYIVSVKIAENFEEVEKGWINKYTSGAALCPFTFMLFGAFAALVAEIFGITYEDLYKLIF